MRTLIQKLKHKRGESVAETLVTVLIIAVGFLFLANAVVTSASINSKADNEAVAYITGETDSVHKDSFKLKINGNDVTALQFELYVTGGDESEGDNAVHYHYYEKKN